MTCTLMIRLISMLLSKKLENRKNYLEWQNFQTMILLYKSIYRLSNRVGTIDKVMAVLVYVRV